VASMIRESMPDCRFSIYGAPLFSDPIAIRYEREVVAAASNLGVECKGWAGDVFAALSGLDLLLVPSVWNEPNPRVILEAFAAGVPVSVFRAGGIPEIVEHNRTGLLASDPAEMAQLALELLADPARRESLAMAARQSWERKFTIERYREQVLLSIET